MEQYQTELHKILNRFNKIRLYHEKGWINILPVKCLYKSPEKYHQIQLNTDTHFNAIMMDIDDEELLTEWSAVGLPVPTIQTVNKNNNKAHLVWLLNIPVSKRNKVATKYYKVIVKSIKLLIGADKAYTNHQTKNFLNKELFRVTYNDVAYDLSDFKSYIIRSAHELKEEFVNIESTGSRHIDMFNQLRFYGYKIAKYKDLKECLTKYAEIINKEFEEPINPKYIVKSVTNFCEENKDNFKASRRHRQGAMKFNKIQNLSPINFKKEVKSRQSKSAKRSGEIKRIKTAAKIKIAIDKLLRTKNKINYSNIAKQAKISLSTVKRNSKIIKIFFKKNNGLIGSIRIIVLEAGEASILPLKYCKAPQEQIWDNST